MTTRARPDLAAGIDRRGLRLRIRLPARATRVGAALRRRWRPLTFVLAAAAGLALVVAGLALIYPPAGLIAGGLAVLALITFNPSNARRLTWPR